MAQATTYFGGDQALFGALEEQRHDGKTGLVFLIIGFTLQIIGTLGLSLNGWLLATLGILGVSLLMWHIFRGKSLRRTPPKRFSAHIERSATVQRAQQKADRASRDR